jgi:hypothetical protein
MSHGQWIRAVQTDGDGNGVGKWGEVRKKGKISVRIIAAVRDHDSVGQNTLSLGRMRREHLWTMSVMRKLYLL